MPTDRPRGTGAAAALLLVTLAAVAVGCSGAGPDAQDPQPSATSASPSATPGMKAGAATPAPSPTTDSTPAPSPSPSESPAATPSVAPTPTLPTKPTEPTKAQATPDEEGNPAPTGLPGLSPTRPDPPLVVLPLPDDAAARGQLVKGFPTFLRPPTGARVATSSVRADSGKTRLQVALGADTAATPEQVLGAYRTRLTARGMQEQGTPALAGSSAVAFVRGSSTITVTVSREGDRTTFSVYGALLSEKA